MSVYLMSPLLIYSNLSAPPIFFLRSPPPYSLIPPPHTHTSYASLEKTTMSIWKENRRKIFRTPIWRSGSTSICIMILIQFLRIPPSPTFLVSTPGGSNQHPQPGPSSDLHHQHHRLPVTLLLPLRHLRRYRHRWKSTRTRRSSPIRQGDNPGRRRQTKSQCIHRSQHGLFPPKREWYCWN